MVIEGKNISTLMSFGLSIPEAKVYLALANLNQAPIKDIANASKVARQDTYRVLSNLHNIGLVKKVVGTPTEYKAISVKEALSILIEHRNAENIRLQDQANQLIEQYNQKSIEKLPENDDKLIIINDMHARMQEAKKIINKLEKRFCIVTSWSFFVTYTLEQVEEIKKALNRGVKIQIVTQKPDTATTLPEALQQLTEHPLFSIRFLPKLPSSLVAIFDCKEVNVSLSATAQPQNTPILWSNNQSIVELAKNYFENTWATATKYTKKTKVAPSLRKK